MQDIITPEEERQAFELGVTAAKNAASWTVDGNTTQYHVRSVLAMLDDGDPAADDYLPAMPDLSGEWADGLTPITLARGIVGDAAVDDDLSTAADIIDSLADAWERGVVETFEPECERILREAIA